ncbi:MAG: hypothetical protein ACR2LK_16875 [Solirubrobacteraceae bacterium]
MHPGEVSVGDRRLVEWVAQASVGDPFPEPFSWARDPLQSMILTLIGLGVMEKPAPGTDWAQVAGEASAAARVWLEENPDAGRPRPWPGTGR